MNTLSNPAFSSGDNSIDYTNREQTVPSPKKILYLDHTASLGGGEIALLNLVQNIQKRDYTPVVVLGAEGLFADRLRTAGIELHIIPLADGVAHTAKDGLGLKSCLRIGSILHLLLYVLKIARFILKHNIDLVHTNSLKADLIGGAAARLVCRPVLWHVRDRIEEDYLPRLVVKAFRKLCAIVPNFVIANSNATLDTIQLPVGARSTAIYSGVDLSRSRVVYDGVADDHYTRNYNQQFPHAPQIGLVGRITPWKGQHVFIRAAHAVIQKYPDARFLIIGSALFGEQDYEHEIKSLVSSLGLAKSVEFTGFCSNITQMISELDILVHASITGEPFGQVVIEGMAAGKPVVATAGGGVPEIVVDGVTGILAPMGDVDAMAGSIERLLDDPVSASAMGRHGRERVQNHFTIDLTARKVAWVYDEVLKRNFAPMPAEASA